MKAVVGIHNCLGDNAIHPDLLSDFEVLGIGKIECELSIVVDEALVVCPEHSGALGTSTSQYRDLLKALTSTKQSDFGDITVAEVLSQTMAMTASTRAAHDRRGDEDDRLDRGSGNGQEFAT